MQEVHDVEAFEHGATYAASVRRHAQARFPPKLTDHPGSPMVSKSVQTIAVPVPAVVPKECRLPYLDKELETFRLGNQQGMYCTCLFIIQGTLIPL
jgi:hypothetical protein